MKRHILFVVNVDWFFRSHRLPLAIEAQKRGWTVSLIAKDTGCFSFFKELGINCYNVDFERSGTNPLKELKLIIALNSIYGSIKPNLIHHITLKPAIYGTIASKYLKDSPKIINAVSGLGYTFTDNRKSVGKYILLILLKYAFIDKKSYFIFQNPDDRLLYQQLGFLDSSNNKIIKGSGVDGDEFPYSIPIKKARLKIVLLARMLKDKGVIEFIKAARLLKVKFVNHVQFILIGGIDPDNPAHIAEEQLKELCDQDYIIWQGYQTDVRGIYKDADVVCLPSYREGLPKSLVEAMAIGRPIVTTDAIGCRECVVDGLNGFLVPVKDSEILAKRIEELIEQTDLRLKMGINSRKKMEEEMSLQYVIKETFAIYD